MIPDILRRDVQQLNSDVLLARRNGYVLNSQHQRQRPSVRRCHRTKEGGAMRPRTGLSDPIDWRNIVGVLAILGGLSLLAVPAMADDVIDWVHAKELSDGPDPVGSHSIIVMKPGAKDVQEPIFVKAESIEDALRALDSDLVSGVFLDPRSSAFDGWDALLGKCDNTQDCDRAVSAVCRDLYGDDRTRGVCTVQQQPDGSGSCEKQCHDGNIIVILCRRDIRPAPPTTQDLGRILADDPKPF